MVFIDFVLVRVVVAGMVSLVAVLCLPDAMAMTSGSLWAMRERLRKMLWAVLELSMQGPFFKIFAFILRKLSCGFLSSSPRPPHALRAGFGGGRGFEVALCWTPRPVSENPFHEESYVISWSPMADGVVTGRWREEFITENGFGEDGGRRWGALLTSLPRNALVRIRMCTVNRRGRSAWSTEELEITPPSPGQPPSSRAVGHRQAATDADGGKNDSRVRCLQCRAPQPASSTVAYGDAVCRPLFKEGCEHGPFCARCRRSMSAQVLPSCICHALIGNWREQSSTKPAEVAEPAEISETAETIEPAEPTESAEPTKPSASAD